MRLPLVLLFLAWLACVRVVPDATALDVLWRDGFEGFNLHTRWSIDNGVWEIGNPTSGPAAPLGGTNVAATVLAGNYPEGADTRLVRRQSFRVPESDNPRLRFRHWFNFNWEDQASVQVRIIGADWETIAVFPQALGTCGRWERASLDLSKYAAKDVQIGFLLHSEINSYGRSYVAEGWYLDNVEVVSGPQLFRNPENFDQPDIWDHWYSDNGVLEVGKPTGAPAERHEGSDAVVTMIDGNYCDAYYGRDSRLISPVFRLPAAPLPELRINHWFSFGLDDYGSVEVSTNANEWVEVRRFDGSGTGQWTSTALDLAGFAGRTLRLGFRFHSQVNANGRAYTGLGWYLNEVQIRLGLLRITPDDLLSEGLVTSETNVVEFSASGAQDGLTYALVPPSPGTARIDSLLGQAWWLPDECDGPGFHWLRVALVDRRNALQPVDFEEVLVQLLEAPHAPITDVDVPLQIRVGEPVRFRASDHAYDPDWPKKNLEYLPEANFPANASLDRFTGELQWTPTLEQGSSTNLMWILVTDSSADRKSSVMTLKPETSVEQPVIQGIRIEAESLVNSVASSWPMEKLQLFSTTQLRSPPDPVPTEWVLETQATWSGREIRVPRVQSRQFFVVRLL